MTTPTSDPRQEALAALALGTLPDDERAAMASWLATDAVARAELQALRESVAAFGLMPPQVDPPSSLRARVLAVTGQPVGEVTPFAPRPPHAAPVAPSRLAWPAWWLAAASALLAIGLGAYAWQLRGRVGTLESSLNETSIRLANADAEIRTGRARLVRARAETSILSAPDLARVDLAGQKTAPGAIARAFWSRAQGLVFTAARLPDLPRGRTYQLWVLTSGAPVSAGLFTPDASGGVSVVFETPVSLPAPTGMAVSVEPDGGVPAPTGDIILAGTKVAD